jgi:hypothetical protein
MKHFPVNFKYTIEWICHQGRGEIIITSPFSPLISRCSVRYIPFAMFTIFGSFGFYCFVVEGVVQISVESFQSWLLVLHHYGSVNLGVVPNLFFSSSNNVSIL